VGVAVSALGVGASALATTGAPRSPGGAAVNASDTSSPPRQTMSTRAAPARNPRAESRGR
jgi:hypothetical protein